MDSTIKHEILQMLQDVIAEENITRIADDAELANIGLDSIRFVQFIVKLESKFEIEVFDSDLLFSNFSTLQKIYETLDKYFGPSTESKLIKCVITDCDGVLWDGIAGEEANDQSIMTQYNVETQRALKFLRNHGIYLCICSKNSQENIENMLDLETPLAVSDISILQCETPDKASSVEYILQVLNLSPDNVAFVDDSLYECGLISAIFPRMTVVYAGDFKEHLAAEILSLFENLPNQPIDRTELYRQQKEREKIRIDAKSVEDYNCQLQTEIDCFFANSEDASRIAELSQRTNRFNASNIRYTEKEIMDLIDRDSHKVYALTATDIYGDMGLVAAAIVCDDVIENFMVSCRVFGRGFENILIEKIKSNQMHPLKGLYQRTTQNSNCQVFYQNVDVEVIER